jgi:ribosomal protein S18 acetylase RimI-like enzyme
VKLQQFDDARLGELMSWFPDAMSLRTWGGPESRFPFSESTFREDAKLASLPTWSLVGDDGELVAFGQCYLRAGRCHMGRLAVSPRARSRGHGKELIRRLSEWGRAEFGVDSDSLFVAPDNPRARDLYRRLGFSETSYPEPSPEVAHFIYMVRPPA